MSEARPIPNQHKTVAAYPTAGRRRGALRLVRPTMSDSADMNGGAVEARSIPLPVDRPIAPPRDVLVNLVRNYVLAHIGRNIPTAELVSVTGVTESSLRRAVASETNTLLAQFITDIRLDRAHSLLSTNRESRSVSELAAALGFNSTPVFSRRYRLRFGEAVSETRRRAVNSYDSSPDGMK